MYPVSAALAGGSTERVSVEYLRGYAGFGAARLTCRGGCQCGGGGGLLMQALVPGDRHTITTTAQVELQRGRPDGAGPRRGAAAGRGGRSRPCTIRIQVLDEPLGAADNKFKLVAISTNFDVPIAPAADALAPL